MQNLSNVHDLSNPCAENRSCGLLIIGNFLSKSRGTRTVCEDLSFRLSEAGWAVITTSSKETRVARLLDMLLTVWWRRREYGVAQVDLYSGRSFYWAEMSCRLLKGLGKPYVLTLHGGNLPALARRQPRRVRRLLSSAAGVTSPSAYLRDQLKALRGDVRLLPNALDLELYPFRPRTQSRPRLVWLRAFHSIYDPMLAPRVLAALLPRFPEARLTMVGPDKRDGSLERTRELAGQLGVADRITFSGAVPKHEVGRRLAEGDIFLNTTTVDNTPVSVIEAMACGLCVVSTDVGGLSYVITDGSDGLLVPVGDTDAMVSAVARVLDDRELSERLSRTARAHAEERDWSVVLPLWQSLLREAEGRQQRNPAS